MFLLTIFCLLIFSRYQFLVAKKIRISKLRSPLEELPPGKINKTLIERGLINPKEFEVSAKDVVENHNQIYHIKSNSYSGDVVGFVAPWNKEGNRIAKRFRHKFSFIVPTWYNFTLHAKELRLRSEGVDKKWLEAWRKPPKLSDAKRPKIAPRFCLNNWNLENFESFINDNKLIASLVSMITKECKDHGYDGVFLDFGPVAFEALGQTKESKKDLKALQRKTQIVANRTALLIQMLGETLARSNLTLHITVAPPTSFYNVFPVIHPIVIQRALSAGWLAGIVVMTYDYGGHKSGSSISPLNWAVGCCEYFQQPSEEAPAEYGIKPIAGSRIHMALNFYGTDNADITYERDLKGVDYIRILKEYKTTFKWDEKTQEHKMEYYDEAEEEHHNVYYPTLLSLHKRLEAARQHGFSLAIWELGAGLEYFLDLL